MSHHTRDAPTTRLRPLLIVLAYLAFVSLGLPDAVLGVAWPSVRRSFDVPLELLGGPLLASAATYFLSGALAERLIAGLGMGRLLLLSTALVALGVAGYATASSLAPFLVACTVVGFGSGAIDSALNAYAASHLGARHMSWLHACYSLGAALGPAAMTAVLARGASWRSGYLCLFAALLLLAVAFLFTRHRWDDGSASAPVTRTAGNALHQSTVWLQLAIFFLYTGVESGFGQWSYSILTEARGVAATTAGVWVSGYYASILGGRVLLGFVVERVGQVRLLRIATLGATVGALVFAAGGAMPELAGLGLLLLGFSLAPMFPGLMAETPRRIGQATANQAIGFQVSAATLGVAVLPGLAGLAGLGAIAWLGALCVLAIALLHELLVART